MLELKRNSLGASSPLFREEGKGDWVPGCVLLMHEGQSLPESSESVHVTPTLPTLGQKQRHICQREISMMMIVTFSFLCYNEYLTETLF